MRRLVSAFAMVVAVLSLSTRSVAETPGYFVDDEGNRVEFRPLYDGWFDSDRYERRYVRAALMNAGMLAFELFIYWYDPNSNTVDWQFPDLGSKLSERSVARFDDNLTRTNWLLHPTAGGVHYGLTRVNGFGVLPSFGVAAASSALYEALFEWREIISINDLIVTPVGGMAVGEAFFQLGNYLNSRQPRPRKLHEVTGAGEFGRRMGSMTFGLPRHANDALDGPPPAPLVPDDALGLSSAYTHRFDVFMGESFVANDEGKIGAVTVLGASSEIIALPGFLRAGRFGTWFGNGNFSRLAVSGAFDDGLREFSFAAGAHLFGHYEQNLRPRPGGLHGTAYEIAGLTALHYSERSMLHRYDQYALVHLLAPTVNVWLECGPAHLRFDVDLAPDFAAPMSLAYEPWTDAFGREGTKSSLLSHSYYFAWGLSAGAHASVAVDDVSVGLKARYGRYESIDGIERMQEEVTRDVHLRDSILEAAGRLAFEPKGTPVSLRIDADVVRRRSEMAPVTVRRSDYRIGGVLGIRF